MPEFIHLHCHTEYSLLDGAIRLKDLCSRAKDYGMSAAAITDHGNLFGAINFYLEAKKIGIKPIIGCEVYVAHSHHQDKSSAFAKTRYHLILLAQNLIGYQNLIKLVSHGYTEGMYYKPRVDKNLLKQYNEGLIALSACLAGEIPRLLLSDNTIIASAQMQQNAEEFGDGANPQGGFDEAITKAKEYASIFPGRFYLELQENGLAEQKILNTKLLELSQATRLPLVATNDCHYLSKDDVEAHDLLLCIQTQNTINDKKRMQFKTKELYYKSPEEMKAAFSYIPEALENTLLIAEQCNLKLDLNSYHFPQYTVSETNSLEEELKNMSRQGLNVRIAKANYSIDADSYKARLEQELEVICNMGFAGYFLIVQDFINYAKNNNIPVGPGRGSAAGSLVAWALKITNIDPIPYQLLFERFLNPERVSMPDIDVDFCERRRNEVIHYVSEKYGQNSVAQITTFGKMKAKAVIRDVGRALGISLSETDKIAKLIPEDLKMTIKKALSEEPVLTELYKNDLKIKKLIDIAMRLEGLNRHASTHAAGVVISDKPLTEYLPIYRGKKDETVTQYDMKIVEKIGLIKFDFLGLKTMTVIQDTLDLIKNQQKEIPDLDNLPLNDQNVFALYSRGDTDGIFQVESSGMRRYLIMLKPTCFDDIIAMLALYRPGPLGSGMVEEFIKRKKGEVPVSYLLPELEECLKHTYGVIVYQEQVMQIARIAAGYTLGSADLLRRAMGKKNIEEMAKQRAKFVEGTAAGGVDANKANDIFNLMEMFAEYGFNKSHSAAYALISYYTAYLKHYFHTEFMAALLSSEINNQDKLLKYISSYKESGRNILHPSIQLSNWYFSVHKNEIVFGLGAIKNVGEEAVRELVKTRGKDGEFKSFLDLCARINLRKMNKRSIENLIKAGACDCFNLSRAALLASLDLTISKAQKKQKEKKSLQVSFLSSMLNVNIKSESGLGFSCPEQDIPEWTDEIKLSFEKEALGFFLTGHPLYPFVSELKRLKLTNLDESRNFSPNQNLKTAVLITKIKEHSSKKGDKMAFCQIEDLTASGECILFPKTYEKYKHLLGLDKPLYLEANIGRKEENNYNNNNVDNQESNSDENDEDNPKEVKLIAQHLSILNDEILKCTNHIEINLQAVSFKKNNLEDLKTILNEHKGTVPVLLNFSDNKYMYQLEINRHCVEPSQELYKKFINWEQNLMEVYKESYE